MRIIRNIEEIETPFANSCVTIGNFDGVHKGHQQLFAKVVDKARDQGSESIVVTFDPHPLQVLRPGGLKMISGWAEKEELIRLAGIDILIVIPFNLEFAKTTAEDFVEEILIGKLGVQELVVGYDYAFGKGRSGNIDFLKEKGRQHGFRVDVVPPFYVQGQIVSSTKIRELIKEGKMAMAAELLGRPYQIWGTVKHGKQRGGSQIGFPTANLHFDDNDLVPKLGVYVVRVKHDGVLYGGVLNIGKNSTFDDNKLVAETHIFNFNKVIYDENIKLFLHKYIRGEIKFDSLEELIAKIAEDVEIAKAELAKFA